MLRTLIVLCLFALPFAVGCGPNVNDASRVPEGAADTSDPSAVNMGGGVAPGAPSSAQSGPSGN